MDDADKTQEYAEAEEAMRRKAAEAKATHHKKLVERCLDCECELPSARREAGYQFCIDCATALEKQAKLYRKVQS